MRRKAWSKALVELETAEKLAPQVTGIRLNIGLTYYRQGSYARAIPAFESVLKDDPQNKQARQLLGLCYLFGLRYQEAASTLESLWDTRNTDLSYLYVLSVAAGNAGRQDLAEKATARLLETGKDAPELHFFMGKALLARGEDESALKELRRAADGNPRLPFVHYNLGLIYQRGRDFEHARQEFLADRDLEPDVAYNYDELGTITLAMGRESEAEGFFREAVKRDATLATSWYGLAKIYKQQKKFTEALQALDKAGDLDSKSASVHYLKAQILTTLHQGARAKAEMDAVKRLQQENADDLEQKISGKKYNDPQIGTEKD
jgi:tetratricopeptide (TPR) repeat protein